MKRLVLIILFAVFAFNSFAWNRLGHAVAVAVAQRHLTDEAKENIAKYIEYDLKQDASWMDDHRKEEHLNYTDHWHSYCVDENFNHDPNASELKLRYGDTVRALQVAESTLRNKRYEQIPDSLVVMSIRTLFIWYLTCIVQSMCAIATSRIRVVRLRLMAGSTRVFITCMTLCLR